MDGYRTIVGHGLDNLITRLSPAGEEARHGEALAHFNREYALCCADRTRPYPGMVELADRLRDRGVRLAVCSNKPDPFCQILMDRFYPGRFAAVRGKREGTPVKPDPAIVHAIFQDLGRTPDRALFAGDSAVDVHTGHNAGLCVCGVAWGFRTRESLMEAGAEFLADTPEDLERVVLTGDAAVSHR